MKQHPEGCGIPVREWVLIFFIIWLSKSTFNLFKIYTLRNNYDKRLTFSMIFFAIANGILIIWLLVGYTFYYSVSNNCGSTGLNVYNTVMLVILCIGYLVIFIYFLALCTVPCLYIWVQRKREDDIENQDDGKEKGNAILRTLSKTKYDPLIYNHENECLICKQEYKPTDNLTVLKCDERHYFHTSCITERVKAGNNKCPFCSAPIKTFNRSEGGDMTLNSESSFGPIS